MMTSYYGYNVNIDTIKIDTEILNFNGILKGNEIAVFERHIDRILDSDTKYITLNLENLEGIVLHNNNNL